MRHHPGIPPRQSPPAASPGAQGGKAKTKPRYTGPTEHQLQTALFNRIKAHKNQVKALEMAFSVPNGFFIPGGKAAGGRIKNHFTDEGLSPGVSDVFLMVPRQGFHALIIEMKTPVGVLSKEQKIWRDNLIDYGYCWRLCKSDEEAWNVIMDYLGTK